jgi:adenylosuccinate lyase
MERTLDDSAGRRLYMPQAFLSIDAILRLYDNVASGMIVNVEMINSNLNNELPFMITENILMNAVKQGGDRQRLHDKIREYAKSAIINVKSGRPNSLIDDLASDPELFMVISQDDVKAECYIGLCELQVDNFLNTCVSPIIDCGVSTVDEEIAV